MMTAARRSLRFRSRPRGIYPERPNERKQTQMAGTGEREDAGRRTAPPQGATSLEFQRIGRRTPIDAGTTDAPRRADERRGPLSRVRERLFGR